MGKQYNLYNLEASFRKFLLAENVNQVTLKNYLSDFRYFSGWLGQSEGYPEPENNETHFTSLVLTLGNIAAYKEFLRKSKFPSSSINRKLSTVRKFCSFCIAQGWMKENPAKKIANVEADKDIVETSFLTDFEAELKKISSAEKSFIVAKDVNEFFHFINS